MASGKVCFFLRIFILFYSPCLYMVIVRYASELTIPTLMICFAMQTEKHNACHELDTTLSPITKRYSDGENCSQTSKRKNGVKWLNKKKTTVNNWREEKVFVMRHIGGISRKWNGKKWKSLKRIKNWIGKMRRVRTMRTRTWIAINECKKCWMRIQCNIPLTTSHAF